MLTLVHKCNVLTHAGDLWVRVPKEMGDKFYYVTLNVTSSLPP
jgi:isocitrate/isopropylmalate dehydrogenase